MMNLKIGGLIIVIVLILGGGGYFFLSRQSASPQDSSFSSPISSQTASNKNIPSSTLKDYTDPSGFIFSYPDNLSLTKIEATDSATYADLELKSKEVDGSINLKIQETKIASAAVWLKENVQTTSEAKEAKWGTLNAQSVEDKDRMQVVAIDQGVLFTMEISFDGQKEFWQVVSNSVLSSFSFSSGSSQETTVQTGGSAGEDVIFEGEEVVE